MPHPDSAVHTVSPSKRQSEPEFDALTAAAKKAYHDASKLQRIVFERLLRTAGHIHTIKGSTLENALNAADPSTFLVRLAEGLAIPEASPYPHYDTAIRRGIELRNWILQKDGGVVTAQEAAAILGLKSRQAIYGLLRQERLLAVPVGTGHLCIPAWQFRDGRILPGLNRTLQALVHKDPWRRLLFFVSANFLLENQRPLDILRSGDIEAVVHAALSHGQQGR